MKHMGSMYQPARIMIGLMLMYSAQDATLIAASTNTTVGQPMSTTSTTTTTTSTSSSTSTTTTPDPTTVDASSVPQSDSTSISVAASSRSSVEPMTRAFPPEVLEQNETYSSNSIVIATSKASSSSSTTTTSSTTSTTTSSSSSTSSTTTTTQAPETTSVDIGATESTTPQGFLSLCLASCDQRIRNPVCSDSGVSYRAPCFAHCHGVPPSNYTIGQCSNISSTIAPGTAGSFLQTCIDTCRDTPTQHVCTASQEQYSTPCEAHCRGIPPSNYTLGECLTTTSSSTTSTTSTPDPDAPTTEALNASAALALCLSECSPVSAPVCASGSHSYFNPCHALCQGIHTFTGGLCTTPPITTPRARCADQCSSFVLLVCANGLTYTNPCFAICDGATLYNFGSCAGYDVTRGRDISSTSSSTSTSSSSSSTTSTPEASTRNIGGKVGDGDTDGGIDAQSGASNGNFASSRAGMVLWISLALVAVLMAVLILIGYKLRRDQKTIRKRLTMDDLREITNGHGDYTLHKSSNLVLPPGFLEQGNNDFKLKIAAKQRGSTSVEVTGYRKKNPLFGMGNKFHRGRTNSYTESQASRLHEPNESNASTRLSQKQGQARVIAMMKDLDRHFGPQYDQYVQALANNGEIRPTVPSQNHELIWDGTQHHPEITNRAMGTLARGFNALPQGNTLHDMPSSSTLPSISDMQSEASRPETVFYQPPELYKPMSGDQNIAAVDYRTGGKLPARVKVKEAAATTNAVDECKPPATLHEGPRRINTNDTADDDDVGYVECTGVESGDESSATEPSRETTTKTNANINVSNFSPVPSSDEDDDPGNTLKH
eukprot:m.639330 g.639330  ORF g.639330 m.639330 type:complete len:829 (+) comp22613_c0_seq5:227-2713(+)